MGDREAMLKRILESEGVFYKSEQLGEPDLTVDEKRTILTGLFTSNPRLFVSRYFHFLSPEDCALFDSNDYDIAFYTKKVFDQAENSYKQAKEKSNIRYAELERLKKESNYFSFEKMREREPYLFDKMIGQYLPEEGSICSEQLFLRPTIENDSLSGLLMQFEEAQIVSDRRKFQCEEDVFGHQEEVGDSPCSSLSKVEKLVLHAECRQSAEVDAGDDLEGRINELKIISGVSEEGPIPIDSDVETGQEQLKNDFIDYMEQKFLREKDAEFFDYATLYNQSYSKELEKMRDRDIEDSYFADD